MSEEPDVPQKIKRLLELLETLVEPSINKSAREGLGPNGVFYARTKTGRLLQVNMREVDQTLQRELTLLLTNTRIREAVDTSFAEERSALNQALAHKQKGAER